MAVWSGFGVGFGSEPAGAGFTAEVHFGLFEGGPGAGGLGDGGEGGVWGEGELGEAVLDAAGIAVASGVGHAC